MESAFDEVGKKKLQSGPVRESNPGPLAPEARIKQLDRQADAYDTFVTC